MTEPINLTQLRTECIHPTEYDHLPRTYVALPTADLLALIDTAEAAIAYQAEMLEDTKTRRISQAEGNFHASLNHYTHTP